MDWFVRSANIATAVLAGLCGCGAALGATYSVEEGFARPGSDYDAFEQTSDYKDHTLCRDACESQPRCKSYTYVKPGVAGGTKAFCMLKDSVPPPVEDFCCISAVKGGKPEQRAVPSMKLEWMGWDADKVSNGPDPAKPDGLPDHRFRLSLRLTSEQEVVAIELPQVNYQGEPIPDGTRWSTRDPKAGYLGVEVDGRRINPTATQSLGRYSGYVVFDLYAHHVGQWNLRGITSVEVLLGDGRKLAHVFLLEPPPDRLIGIWQMHCSSHAPNAFEPMTIDGNLQLVRQGDDRVAGYFGTLPLSGRLDKNGRVEGIAETVQERVVWQGKLDQFSRGKPLRGSGGFRFERTESACLGEGMWSHN